MKNSVYVFFYAKELLLLSVFLTIVYLVCTFFLLPVASFIIPAKIVLPLVFFMSKKMSDQSTLYFLYNLGMRDVTIVLLLLFFTTVDVFLLQFILP